MRDLISILGAVATHRIKFVDCYPSWSYLPNNYILTRLRPHFNLEIVDEPDYLFYSVIGFEHAHPRYDHCVKIWFTDENFRPNFSNCDYAVSFDYLADEPRHLRLPNYVKDLVPGELVKTASFNPEAILKSKTRFSSFICSNNEAQTRLLFYRKLSAYKPVDSAGSVFNNMGYRAAPGLAGPRGKLEFITPYKFSIAFENSRYPGYTTEKIVAPMKINSLPIYWGNPLIAREFNPKSFINCNDYPSLDDVVDEVVQLDQDDDRYLSMLSEPWFNDNIENEYCQFCYGNSFFAKVFSTPVHTYSKWSGVTPRNFGIIDDMPGFVRDDNLIIGPSERRVFE
jgi:hypothetical protein